MKSNKNDLVDAEAICEAMSRPGMRFVAVKSVEQQDVQAAHRIREELVGQRTAKSNQIRGLVGEYGLVTPVGIRQLRQALPLQCSTTRSRPIYSQFRATRLTIPRSRQARRPLAPGLSRLLLRGGQLKVGGLVFWPRLLWGQFDLN